MWAELQYYGFIVALSLTISTLRFLSRFDSSGHKIILMNLIEDVGLSRIGKHDFDLFGPHNFIFLYIKR